MWKVLLCYSIVAGIRAMEDYDAHHAPAKPYLTITKTTEYYIFKKIITSYSKDAEGKIQRVTKKIIHTVAHPNRPPSENISRDRKN